jgi:hypothetical protein
MKLFVLLLTLLLASPIASCTASVQRGFHTAIVGTAAGVKDLDEQNVAAYRSRAAQVRAEVLARPGATAEDYDRAIAPVNRSFDQRTEAIAAASAALYAAAALKEALGKDLTLASVMQTAGRMLTAVRAMMDSLADGSVLPAVKIPQNVRTAIATLESLSGGSSTPTRAPASN